MAEWLLAVFLLLGGVAVGLGMGLLLFPKPPPAPRANFKGTRKQ